MNKKLVLLLLLLVCVGVAGAFFKTFFTTQTSSDYRNITDMETSYNADEEIGHALERIKNSQDKSTVITHADSGRRVVALTFDGLTDRTVLQRILDLLTKYDAKATFFIDGIQTAEDPQSVVLIKKQGQHIENYTLLGMPKMEKLPQERLIKDFCRAQKIIKVNTDQEPNLLKCNDTKYTEQLLKTAKACGFNSVVKSDIFVNPTQVNSPAAADDFVNKLKPGSIVSIKLKVSDEPIPNEKGKTDLRPAIDKQPGLKELPQTVSAEQVSVVDAVEQLLAALKKANYTTDYVGNFPRNTSAVKTTTYLSGSQNQVVNPDLTLPPSKLFSFLQEQVKLLFSCRTAYAAEKEKNTAEEIKMVYTTEPALSFTFGGLSNEACVDDVLDRLQKLGIKATFFVMEVEIKKYPDAIRKIVENGHEVGIALRPRENAGFDDIYQEIERCRHQLLHQFGVTTNLVKQPWGTVSDSTKEAVASAGCRLIGQSFNIVQSRHKNYTSANQVVAEIFKKHMTALARGEIVHFRMDYYAHSYLVGDLLEIIKQSKIDNIAYATSFDNPANNWENDSQYVIKPVGQVLNNTRLVYQYPADIKSVPEDLRNDGDQLHVDRHNFMSVAASHYIGSEFVNDEDRTLGFSKMEMRRLDKSGVIHTADRVIFLTFDDWGTDASINKLLYVLRKHSVKGSFFILTNNVLNNPNLLRSIAVEGHDIGSHSDKHKPMAVLDLKTGKQVGVQNREEYTQDLSTAYKKLRSVVGDITVNGRPALTRFFRPPTLAISKMGFEVLFATGYEYIISGTGETEDYAAQSLPGLIGTMKDELYTKNGTLKRGMILVMHMSEDAVYTAMALDILLTANEAKPDSDPSKFKVGRLSDYLTAGYYQNDRKKIAEAERLNLQN